MRARARSIRRRGASQNLATLFVIVVGGRVTEPSYFRIFEEKFGHPGVRMRVIHGEGDPRTIVEKAIQERGELSAGRPMREDSVWAVFDRDQHERFSEAVDLARGNKISLAISNPCFELWGIYHYRDLDAPIGRHECQRLLEEVCSAYDRHSHKSFASLELVENGYREAVRRGSVSMGRRKEEGNPGASPCTSVYCLTEEFRQVVTKVRKRSKLES